MKKLLIFCIALTFLSCEKDDEGLTNDCNADNLNTDSKINGGSMLQTWRLFNKENPTIDLAQKTNANWVSLSPLISMEDISIQNRPYKYRFPVSAEVEKMKEIIPVTRKSGLHNIMLKPITSFGYIGVNDPGFWGDFIAIERKS